MTIATTLDQHRQVVGLDMTTGRVPEPAMHPRLEALPLPLTEQLGTRSRLEWLQRLPQVQGVAHDMLFRARDAEPYLLNAEDKGLTLVLQCLDPTLPANECQWGFQGFTLDATTWNGPWFDEAGPSKARAETLIEQLAETTEEVMHQHPMLCFAVRGKGGQTWSVVATFDYQSKYLNTVSMTRVGDWREAATVPKAPHSDEGADTVAQESDSREGQALVCQSGARAPKTGVWEGRLPTLHAQAGLFAQAPHRFVFKQAGDPMGTLGLPPQDEAQVVWTWLRGQ